MELGYRFDGSRSLDITYDQGLGWYSTVWQEVLCIIAPDKIDHEKERSVYSTVTSFEQDANSSKITQWVISVELDSNV